MKTTFSLVSYGIPQPLPDTWLLMVNAHELINRIYYILEEGAGYIKDEKKIPFKKGYFYFLPTTSGVEYYLDNKSFTHAYIDFMDSKVYPKDILIINPDDNPVLKSEIDVFINFLKSKKLDHHSLAKHSNPDLYYDSSVRIKYILSSFLYDITPQLQYKKENPAIIRSIEYIKSNYINDIKLKELADMAAFSVNHFTRLFEEHTGMTPHQYIKKLRLDMAIEFLKTDMPITEIAEKCGFMSAASFSSTFKKSMGQKPSNFRNT